MGERNWYVRRGKTVRGPFPHPVVQRLVNSGRLREEDEFSADLRGWRPLSLLCPVTTAATAETGPRPRPATAAAPVARRYLRLVGERDQPRWVQCAGLLGIGVALVVAAVALRTPAPDDEPQCAAAPGPGVNWNNCVRDGLSAERLDLSGARARNARLRGAQLFGARLGRADLAYAMLAEADLSYADLRGADLTGADLRGADLAYANLRGANLGYADLTGAVMSQTAVENAHFGHALWTDGHQCAPGATGACPAAGGSKTSEN